MIKVLLVDNQALTRIGVTTLLANSTDIQLEYLVLTNQLINQIDRLKPDLLIIDPHSDMLFDNEFLNGIRNQFDGTEILILSGMKNPVEITTFTNHYLYSHVSKECSTDELINAIHSTAKGKPFFCERTLKILAEDKAADLNLTELPTLPGLTSRESEIIHLISEGLTNNEIAARLFLSFHTIKSHRKNIIKKLGFTFKNVGELSVLIKSIS